MKSMRTLLLIALLQACFLKNYAQIVPIKGAFQADLARVVADFPNHFINYLGELLKENPQSTDYQSSLMIKDGLECTITKYSAEGKEIYSWGALMARTEEFNKAEKKFKTLFQSIQNLTVQVNGEKLVFKGVFEKPAGKKKFTSIIFKPGQENELLKKIRIELSIQTELLEWVVRVIVYDVEREANEKGDQREEKFY